MSTVSMRRDAVAGRLNTGFSSGTAAATARAELGDHVSDLHPTVTHEVVDTHPHRRLQQPLLTIDQPESLLVVQITDRHRQRIDVAGRTSPRGQGTLEQHEQIARLGPQPAQPDSHAPTTRDPCPSTPPAPTDPAPPAPTSAAHNAHRTNRANFATHATVCNKPGDRITIRRTHISLEQHPEGVSQILHHVHLLDKRDNRSEQMPTKPDRSSVLTTHRRRGMTVESPAGVGACRAMRPDPSRNAPDRRKESGHGRPGGAVWFVTDRSQEILASSATSSFTGRYVRPAMARWA